VLVAGHQLQPQRAFGLGEMLAQRGRLVGEGRILGGELACRLEVVRRGLPVLVRSDHTAQRGVATSDRARTGGV